MCSGDHQGNPRNGSEGCKDSGAQGTKPGRAATDPHSTQRFWSQGRLSIAGHFRAKCGPMGMISPRASDPTEGRDPSAEAAFSLDTARGCGKPWGSSAGPSSVSREPWMGIQERKFTRPFPRPAVLPWPSFLPEGDSSSAEQSRAEPSAQPCSCSLGSKHCICVE